MSGAPPGPGVAWRQAAASCVILAVLFVQAVVAFNWDRAVFRAQHRKGYYWPFLDYPMYKGAHYAGEEFDRHKIIGVWLDGREAEIVPEDFGLNFWKFEKGPVRVLEAGDRRALEPFLAAYARRHEVRPAALRLENHPWVLGPRGVERAAARTLATLTLASEPKR